MVDDSMNKNNNKIKENCFSMKNRVADLRPILTRILTDMCTYNIYGLTAKRGVCPIL